MKQNLKYLELAIEQAKKSFELGGFPAGSVIVKNGEVISEGVSCGLLHNDPIEHGEVNAIRNACLKLSSPWIKDCILYSSMEPCLMCLGACGWANIKEIHYACKKETAGNSSYLGSYSNQEIVNTFTNKINLNYIEVEGFEKELIQMISVWEKKNFG
jgi:guanine deaminase